MFVKREVALLDCYLAELVETALGDASSAIERRAILQRAARLARQVAKSALQGQLLAQLGRQEAAKTLLELEQFVEPQHGYWLKQRPLPLRQPQNTSAPREAMLSPGEVARELGVSTKTVANWCKRGLLRCEVLASGHRRISAGALESYRVAQANWERLDALTNVARGADPAPDDEAIFAELAARRHE